MRATSTFSSLDARCNGVKTDMVRAVISAPHSISRRATFKSSVPHVTPFAQRGPMLVLGCHSGAMLDKHAINFNISPTRRQVSWCVHVVVRGCHVRAVLDAYESDFDLSLWRR